MIKVTRTQIRPSASVGFYTPIEQKAIWTTINFCYTGKLTISHNTSTDELTKTSVWLWQDQESFNTYLAKDLVIDNRNAEIEYHNSKGITFTETIETI